MIITCSNCNKKFSVGDDQIPENGRLLQCSSCQHKWFFKIPTINKNIIEKNEKLENNNKIPEKIIEKHNNENSKIFENEENEENENEENKENNIVIKNHDKLIEKPRVKISKEKKPFLNYILVVIISCLALILIIDTFEKQIILVVPEAKHFLESLYDTIYDIFLVFKNLF